jgi:CHASE2 domain-containing sensor protein
MSTPTVPESASRTEWLTWKKVVQLAMAAALIFLGDGQYSLEIFRHLERWLVNTDVQLFGAPRQNDVAIVEIDRIDYAARFNRRSPLDAAKLREIIGSLAAAGPRLLVVDIDTSAGQFEGFADMAHSVTPAGGGGPVPVVWARDAQLSHQDRRRYFLANLLGLPRTRDTARYGAAVLHLDGDRIVRRYTRMVDSDEGQTPTLAFAAVQTLRNKSMNGTDTTPWLVRWSATTRTEGTARQRSSVRVAVKLIADPRTNPLRDKVVILGGAYDTADEHLTPVGWLSGAEIVAQIIETELGGGGRAPANQFRTFVIALASTFIVYWFIRRPWKHAFWISLAAVLVMSIAGSIVATSTLTLTLTPRFMLVLLAVIGHQSWLLAREKQIAEKERRERARQEAKGEVPV